MLNKKDSTQIKTVKELLNGQQVVPVVVIENQQQAFGLAQALLDGGVSSIEITLRHEYGLQAIEEVKNRFPDMLVIAGTVNTPEDMDNVIKAGVDAVVSPGTSVELLEIARQQQVPYLPGVATPSDIMTAINAGLNECKLFPASVVGGVNALKAYAGPFQDVSFCPTGGVSGSNYRDYLALPNVMCVGGSWITPAAFIREQRWSEITQLCKSLS